LATHPAIAVLLRCTCGSTQPEHSVLAALKAAPLTRWQIGFPTPNTSAWR
jgi:hypothetical protein